MGKEEKLIELNVIFQIEKGNRKRRWKAIEHPNFDNSYALVADHPHLYEGCLFAKEDIKHTVYGGSTLEQVWQAAYNHT